MGAPSKRARKTRAASEFDISRLLARFAAPRENAAVYSWSLTEIYNARNAQMRGDFRLPARLAESMRTDDALFVAFHNRLAPQRCIKLDMVPAKRNTRGESIANEADALYGQQGVGVHPDTIADIHGSLVNHGLAVGFNAVSQRYDSGDRGRTDLEHLYWPIEFVRWDEHRKQLMARLDLTSATTGEATVGGEVPIVHGDGRWVVYQKASHLPWRHGAILAAALVWARHAFTMRDWAKSSLAHGLAKVIGEMAEGVALQSADGQMTPEAASFLDLLLGMANSDNPVGIRPAGSKTEFVANSSTAWQIFEKLAENAEKAAARIYLGTDGTLGAQGGAPGVDISELFGVASTIVQGDLECIERGFKTGVIDPWCALNFGDSSLAPTRKYLLPDPDEDRARASIATRTEAFYAELEKARANGMLITQEFVDAVAKKNGVEAPTLAPTPAPAATPLRAAR